MRIIAGTYRSRRLQTLPGMITRPTLDRNRENMFNLLGGFFEGGRSLDVFGGSGALSLEALSRGIDHAVIIEKAKPAQRIIEANVTSLGVNAHVTLLKQDYNLVFRHIHQHGPFDLVLLDPPFAMQVIELIIMQLDQANALAKGCLIACETPRGVEYPETIGRVRLIKQQNYGVSTIRIYTNEDV
jgi:16S rRNA (guanine966-N2)-methyltransferase